MKSLSPNGIEDDVEVTDLFVKSFGMIIDYFAGPEFQEKIEIPSRSCCDDMRSRTDG